MQGMMGSHDELLRKMVELVGPGLLNKADGSDGVDRAIAGLKSGFGGVEGLGGELPSSEELANPEGLLGPTLNPERFTGLSPSGLGEGVPGTMPEGSGTSSLVGKPQDWSTALMTGLQGVQTAAAPSQGGQGQPQPPPITPMLLAPVQGQIVSRPPMQPYQSWTRRRRRGEEE
jgi:hypothetical protein